MIYGWLKIARNERERERERERRADLRGCADLRGAESRLDSANLPKTPLDSALDLFFIYFP